MLVLFCPLIITDNFARQEKETKKKSFARAQISKKNKNMRKNYTLKWIDRRNSREVLVAAAIATAAEITENRSEQVIEVKIITKHTK